MYILDAPQTSTGINTNISATGRSIVEKLTTVESAVNDVRASQNIANATLVDVKDLLTPKEGD